MGIDDVRCPGKMVRTGCWRQNTRSVIAPVEEGVGRDMGEGDRQRPILSAQPGQWNGNIE